MHKKITQKGLISVLMLYLASGFTSCVSTKTVPYFQDISLSEQSELASSVKFTEPLIQPDDILSISIFTIDPGTNMVINQVGTQAVNTPASSISGLATTSSSSGFLVDRTGDVDIPIVGKVAVKNLTTSQARDIIKERAARVYANPSVQVRFANFKVTVLGEVANPAAYVMPNEKVTLLDALGLAGDLTIFGKRENVILIRDTDGKKEFARFNLNSKEIFNNPYFYLKQNDVIYVEPNKSKAASLNSARAQTYGIIGASLSVLIVLFSRL